MTEIGSFGPVSLVRYRLGSRDLAEAYARAGGGGLPFQAAGNEDGIAVFGVVEEMTKATAGVLVAREAGGTWYLVEAVIHDGLHVSGEVMERVLQAVGLPPYPHGDVRRAVADRWDCWHEDGRWERRDPVYAVVVPVTRVCRATSPVVEERLHVIVAEDPDIPLNGHADWDSAMAAQDHYRHVAMGLAETTRRTDGVPFSAWAPEAATLVKVTDPDMYEAFRAREDDPALVSSAP